MNRDKPDYGLYVGIGNQFRLLDSMVEHDIDLQGNTGSDKTIPMWTYDATIELMKRLKS